MEDPPNIVYTTGEGMDLTNPSSKDVSIQVEEFTANKIRLTISTPKKAFIASSEIWDKGWGIIINDKRSILYNVSNGFRGFIVSPGKNFVEMTYFPPYLYEGILVSSIGIIFLVLLYKYGKWEKNKKHSIYSQ
jgi:uncharacterized membrane protein YfhO